MYLYGAGGHAKVIIDILNATNIPIEALFDGNKTITALFEYPVLPETAVKGPLIISIGNNEIRKKIAGSLSVTFGIAIHPRACISERALIKEGTVVMQGAIIQSCAEIGKHCIINSGASVDHDCIINDFAHISPHCTLCGSVHIGEGSWIGAGTTILPGITIGKWCTIGAGSVVTKNIPDGMLAVGNRCAIIKKIK